MASAWVMRCQWPPSPSVEDESDALAHEVNGASVLSKKSGDEGVCARGTIDQYPIILMTETPPRSATADSNSLETSSRASSSTESQGPPTPPPVLKDEPRFHHVDGSLPVSFSASPTSFNKVRFQSAGNDRYGPQDRPTVGQHETQSRDGSPGMACGRMQAPSYPSNNMQGSNQTVEIPSGYDLLSPKSTASRFRVDVQELERQALVQSLPSRNSVNISDSGLPQQDTPHLYRGHSDQLLYHEQRVAPSGAYCGDRDSFYCGSNSDRPKSDAFVDLREARNRSSYASSSDESCCGSSLRPGYSSDTATARKEVRDSYDRQRSARFEDDDSKGSHRRATISESIDDKRRRNRDPEFPAVYATRGARGYSDTTPIKSSAVGDGFDTLEESRSVRSQKPGTGYYSNVPLPASAPQSPLQRPYLPRSYSQLPPYPLESSNHSSSPPPTIRRDALATSFNSGSVAQNSPTVLPPIQELPRASSHDSVVSSQQSRRRTVSFSPQGIRKSESPQRVSQQNSSLQTRLSRQGSPSKELIIRRASPDPASLCLLPCPRSIPMAGYQDWYTIRGLTHLDICPSCMKQIGQSKFRDFFIPSLPKPRGQKVRCSLSEPWARLAWLQTIKLRHNDLEMLYQITRPSAGSKPCPGRTVSVQSWYKVIDPETGTSLPKFNACSACVRNLRILMPAHRDTFKCSTLVQERFCDLTTDSARFVQYLDLLDAAANKYEYERLPYPDMQDFVDYARRKTSLHDCRRDRLILSTWHYIPELPEFSICEDCYDDVVRPMAKANRPIARMVSRKMRLLPGYGPSQCREASCQLYSPRMRTRFREAVQNDDYTYLKLVALKRYQAELRFRDRKANLLDGERRGYDRDVELRVNAEEWRKWE